MCTLCPWDARARAKFRVRDAVALTGNSGSETNKTFNPNAV